jgi:rhamnosyltransferase
MDMKSSLLVATVAYKAPSTLGPRLELIRQSDLPVWVFDNSPGQHESTYNATKVLTKEHNVGLGPALYRLLSEAHQKGFDYLWYLDQDTVITELSIQAVKNAVEAGFSDKQVLAWASNQPSSKVIPLAISSGSLFHLPSAKELGFHNPEYFVEGVDYEFCLRAAIKGYNLISFHCPGLDHEVEQPQHLGHGKWRRRYPLSRTMAFEWVLFKLALKALFAGKAQFSYLFLRNMATHAVSQLWVYWKRKL